MSPYIHKVKSNDVQSSTIYKKDLKSVCGLKMNENLPKNHRWSYLKGDVNCEFCKGGIPFQDYEGLKAGMKENGMIYHFRSRYKNKDIIACGKNIEEIRKSESEGLEDIWRHVNCPKCLQENVCHKCSNFEKESKTLCEQSVEYIQITNIGGVTRGDTQISCKKCLLTMNPPQKDISIEPIQPLEKEMTLPEIFERIKSLSEKQLKDPNENTYTILAHTLEEVGEFSTAICIEDKSGVKGYKNLEESASNEAVDILICALSLYYSRNGKTEDLIPYLNKKLDKWETKIS